LRDAERFMNGLPNSAIPLTLIDLEALFSFCKYFYIQDTFIDYVKIFFVGQINAKVD